VIYDGKTHKIVEDPRYMGTYNYVVPDIFPPEPKNDIRSYVRFGITGIGHTVCDVIPYYFGRNVRGKY